jgi:hypothetical protein
MEQSFNLNSQGKQQHSKPILELANTNMCDKITEIALINNL